MKRLIKLIFTVLILLFFNNAFSQWYLPSGDIFDCEFPAQDTGYVVGESGTIRKTFDGGTSWHLLHSETSYDVEEVHFITANTGYVYTSNEILATNDGGYSWEKITNPSDYTIVDVFFLNKNDWFLIDLFGDFFSTSNGGSDWNEAVQFESRFSNEYRNVLFLDQNKGFIVGDYLYSTTNGGSTWTKNTDYYVDHIYFLNNNIGFIYGSMTEYKTIDGGFSWEEANTPGLGRSMDFSDYGTGYYVDNEKLYKSIDYGNNWTEQTFFDKRMNDVVILSDNSCTVVGYNAEIYKTDDEGLSWDTISNFPIYNVSLDECTFINESKVIVIDSRGAVLMSYDGGVTWKIKVGQDDWGVYSYALFFVDENIGYVATNPGLFKTTDGGETWNQVNSTVPGFNSDLFFFDSENGFLVNYQAKIFKTTDGGVNWEEIVTEANRAIFEIHFIDSDNGFVIGENDCYLYTTDGGDTWTKPYISPLQGDHSAIWFHDSQNGVIGGSRIYKTSDGGQTWTIFSNPDEYINSFYFFGEDTIFSASDEVYHNWVDMSIDGGMNWSIIQWNSISTVFTYIDGFEDKEMIAVGEYILKPALTLISPSYDPDYTDVKRIEPEKEYSISPNPVKDQLHISTLKSDNSLESIEVIDIYGRIISKQKINNDGNISLSFLKSGNYIIRINGKYHYKIVKE